MSRKADHDRRTFDSSGHYGGRMFNVAVVGLSGTEKDKGCLGVGKSCLCNRFIRPQADEYNRDHISILSQPDFSGPIVNNEHWLYWGETRKCTDEGFELTFSVVEQTEFVDDACFQPFRSGKTMEPYHKRCAATRLNSAEKLMYICKNQLGIEKEYEQHYLPDGRFNVDGFVCVFDVSQIQGRSIERQIEITALILTALLKTKKPVVLATTKNDESSDLYVREAEKLANRREFKGLIPLVETSAHDNVNVDLAFWACVQRDWPKGKTKILSYHEAYQKQRDRLEIVNDAYLTLIRSNITDYRTHWNNTYSNLSQSQDFITYCDLFGQESAQQTFKRHVKKLKEEYVCRKIDMYLRRLPKVFTEMLPDLESFGPDHSWPAIQQILHEHPLFNSNFVLNESLSWQEMDDSSETRIPFDLLQTPEAEKAFFDHLSSLLAEEHLRSLRYQFSELLRETSVVPGQPLKEIRDQLKDRDCVQSLPESELKLIYEEYQKILQQDARDQLNELFLERTPLFLQFATGKMLTQDDLTTISHELSKDERWLTLDLIPQDRQLALIRYLGFLQWPIKEHCSAGQACVELNIEAYHSSLAKRNSRNPLWNQELEKIQIKFVVLGSSTYADNLGTVVKAMCPSLEQENPRVQYDMQIVPSNETGIFPFRPYLNPLQSEAYLCLYSSRASLEYLLKTLEHSLLADLQFGSLHPTGLPLVLLLACTPDTSAKERNYLREEGQNRAQCLQCAFFDVTSNEPHARFKSDELLRALIFLSETLIRRAEMNHIYGPNLTGNNAIPEGALNPEIRILISLMCGDPISPARFLESLILLDSLPNSNFYPVSEHSFVTDVGFLLSIEDEDHELVLNEIPSCYVEFVVSSYHSSFSYKEELFYGNILVYWSKRQASFSNMSALASVTATMMPIQILALVENELRPSKLSHQLVAKGQELADQLQAHFRVSTLGAEMGRCISSFLNYAIRNKHLIEKNLHITTTANAVLENFEQQSPHSAISSEECFEANAEENFESMLAPHPLNLNRPAELNCDSPKILPEGIYERLPEEQQLSSKAHHSSNTSTHNKNSQLHELSSLVRPARGHLKKIDRFSPEALDVGHHHQHHNEAEQSSHFFSTLYNANEQEHLVKPSEMRQRRHLHQNNNNYYNLQSYPSADSLDRIYAINSHYSGYYDDGVMAPMPAHYVYRPSVHRMGTGHGANNFVESSSSSANMPEEPPPRPASSAHIFMPRHSHQPPPYSRVAISPPPAYKIQSHYPMEMSTDSGQMYSNYHPNAQLEPNTLAYYQRKYYPHQQVSAIPSMYSTFRNHGSPSFSPFNDNYDKTTTGSLIPNDLIQNHLNTTYQRYSPMIYATTGRHYNQQYSRSPHFHQQIEIGKNLPAQHAMHSLRNAFDHNSPSFAEERSSLHRGHHAKKKKKKHSLKTRSSSLSHRMTNEMEQEVAEDEEQEEHSAADSSFGDGVKPKRPIGRLRKKRTGDDRSMGTRKTKTKEGNQNNQDKKKTSSENLSVDKSQKLIEVNKNDSESEVVENEDDDDDDEPGDEPKETQSANRNDDNESDSSNSSADDNLNATADKFAVVSGWAYHQNNRSPISNLGSNRLAEQWPPVQQPNDENSMANEKSKAPGKIDLKKFNNLSDAIGRLNLHSPLGPTRIVHSTFEDLSKSTPYDSKEQFTNIEESKIQLGTQERSNVKYSLSTKDVDSESEVSDTNNLNEQNSELSNLNERLKFNSLKPSTVGGLAPKKIQKNKRRITPVPVAPPRLPSSANSSNAVTPTSSGVGKSFTSFSSYDDDKHTTASTASDSLKPNLMDPTSYSLDIVDDNKMMESGELRRNRWHQFSKLFSLPADHESGISVDENSLDAASEDTSASHSTNLFNSTKGNANNNNCSNNNVQSNADKAKFLKSKSIGTFSELDKKSIRKAEKLEKKRIKEEERKNRKNLKETSRNRSRSKGTHSSLEDFAQTNGNPVPLFIEKCTYFIEQEGLDMEGIYRVPGNRAHVDTLLQKFDENSDINIAELDIPVNAVATALKDFFLKRLPPIFPPDSMTNIANLAKQYTDNGALGEMRTFLQALPNSNLQIIKHMISHFVKIVEKSSVNSMDSKNLAICWWPTLLQFEFNNMDFFEQKRPHLMNFVQIMIDSYQELFSTSSSSSANNNNDNNNNLGNSEENIANLSCSVDELSSL